MSTATETYQQRLAARQASFAAADSVAAQFGNLRLVIVIAILASAWYAQWWAAGAAVLAFLIVGNRIQTLQTKASRYTRAIDYYKNAIERTQGNWQGKGTTGEAYRPTDHLYASDLDLFGPGSLFELLCQARTRIGESTLAAWLLEPASPETILCRQQAIQELGPNLDLREDLAVIASANSRQVRAAQLADWGDSPQFVLAGAPRTLLRLAALIGALGAAALVADVLGAEFPYLRIGYLTTGILCGVILWRFRLEIRAVLESAEGAAQEVALLAAVLERLESQTFQSPLLVSLHQHLIVEGQPPSRRIAQLRRWMDLVDSRDHFLIRVLGPFILYDLHLAFALEDWRKQSGSALRRWITAVGEIEALSSLANYHFEHPANIFPTLLSQGPVLEAVQLTHPLMPLAQAIPNDIRLGLPLQALVVSGSNMSGKSTLMRTVGANVVLALAGAPVCAVAMSLSPLAVGASISTHDSLQGNTSRFYAEILRLRDVMLKASSGIPVLFLIDEVLSGTNSHDRRIGAAAILKGLVERKAIGITSTHDLALTQIVDELGDHAANVHFEDQLIDGRMQFDYKMQPGVVTHSNAIALMRAIGLEV